MSSCLFIEFLYESSDLITKITSQKGHGVEQLITQKCSLKQLNIIDDNNYKENIIIVSFNNRNSDGKRKPTYCHPITMKIN